MRPGKFLVMPRAKTVEIVCKTLAVHRPVSAKRPVACSSRQSVSLVSDRYCMERLPYLLSCSLIRPSNLRTGGLPTRTTSLAKNLANPDRVMYALGIESITGMPRSGRGSQRLWMKQTVDMDL